MGGSYLYLCLSDDGLVKPSFWCPYLCENLSGVFLLCVSTAMPGQCPPVPMLLHRVLCRAVEECSCDAECEGNLKCCFDGCIRTCKKPGRRRAESLDAHPCLVDVFIALTLLVGRQEEHPACIKWAIRCWRGYLSGTRCNLFAYGTASLESRLV